ncbi:MAG: sugar phosphate isomerase/epimerase [Planctomycetes bacterium]|nr:sugar phosphate isomerase/epimerase [Planctomycetota bacterium]
MPKLLVRAIHSPEFLEKWNLGVELHLGRYEKDPNWRQYIPFIASVHLPYANLNAAAVDADERRAAIQAVSEAIDTAAEFGPGPMVMHSLGIEYDEKGEHVGRYDLLIESLGTLADRAASHGATLCLENNLVYWGRKKRCWGDSAKGWYTLRSDVDRPNVKLTLDSSHAANNTMAFDNFEERCTALKEFLAHRELIGHVHWSDSIITTDAGKTDQHLVPGKGDLPREFHQSILALKTLKLLEQNCTEAEVVEGIKFIEGLK